MKLCIAAVAIGALFAATASFGQLSPAVATLAPKAAAINRNMVDQQLQTAKNLRRDGNIERAASTMVSVINQLTEHGYEQDALRLMREMTLDREPAFANAGAELLGGYYYYNKYLVLQPTDPEWLMEARAWAVYSGNETLLNSFTPLANDAEHSQAMSAAVERGHSIKADDHMYLAFERIRANERAQLRAELRRWPYDINRAHSQDGTSLLHKAVWYKKTDIVRMLVDEFKADVNSVDDENDTPLDYARYQQAREIIEFLTLRKARANKQYGQNPSPAQPPARQVTPPAIDHTLLLENAQPYPAP